MVMAVYITLNMLQHQPETVISIIAMDDNENIKSMMKAHHAKAHPSHHQQQH